LSGGGKLTTIVPDFSDFRRIDHYCSFYLAASVESSPRTLQQQAFELFKIENVFVHA